MPSSPQRLSAVTGASLILVVVAFLQILAYDHNHNQWLRNLRLVACVTEIKQWNDEVKSPAEPSSAAAKKTKPTLILHVGPMKTASTTIQRELLGIGNHKGQHLFHESFQYDNIRVASKFGLLEFRRLVHDCLQKTNVKDCNMELWKEFVGDLHSKIDTGDPASTTVIYSSESLAWTPDTAVTRQLFQELGQDWDIRVVLFYRRPYDWIRSLYYQLRKANHYDTSTHQWRRFPSLKEYRNGNMTRLKAGGKPTFLYPQLTLPEFLNPRFLQFTRDSAETKEFFESLLSHSSNSSTVTSLDFYANHGIAVEFLCFGVDAATESCKQAKEVSTGSSSTNIVHVNAGESYFYEEDYLVLEAHRQGLIQNKTLYLSKREKVTKALHLQLSKWNTTIQEMTQQVCPNSIQREWLWRKTAVNNAHAAPTPVAETQLRTEFDAFLDSSKLCSVDAATLLTQTKWQTFFQTACMFRKSADAGDCTDSFVLNAESNAPVAAVF